MYFSKSHSYAYRGLNLLLSVNASSRAAVAHEVAPIGSRIQSVSFLPYGVYRSYKDEVLEVLIIGIRCLCGEWHLGRAVETFASVETMNHCSFSDSVNVIIPAARVHGHEIPRKLN